MEERQGREKNVWEKKRRSTLRKVRSEEKRAEGDCVGRMNSSSLWFSGFLVQSALRLKVKS